MLTAVVNSSFHRLSVLHFSSFLCEIPSYNDASIIKIMSQYSSDVTVTGYGLDGRSSIYRKDKGFFCTQQPPDRFSGPPYLPQNYISEILSPGVKRPNSEPERSSLCSILAKNCVAILSLTHTHVY
jgi:hypothetical protein